MSAAMDFEYELIQEDEFDALTVELKGVGEDDVQSRARYPAKLHARKVAAELGVQSGLIYLPGEPSRQFEDSDQGPPFHQRRYFFYLTGANFANCHATYDVDNDHLILFIPFVEPRQVLWFGRLPTAAQAMQTYDVDDVRYSSHLTKYIDGRLGHADTLYCLHPDQMLVDAAGPLRQASARHYSVDFVRLQPAMDRARVIKTAAEVRLIRRANDISSAAHRSVARMLLRLSSEREIQATVLAVCTARGAPNQAYPVIAGAGVNASTLHYADNNKPLRGKQLVVLDAGCEFDCYASDVTRTLPIGGAFTREASAVHDLVQRMQDECIAMMRPGVDWADVHAHAARVALDGLLRLRILRGDADAIADAGTVAAFFPHGLGHHVGLEVHDVSPAGPNPSARAGGKREMVTAQTLSGLLARAKTDAVVKPAELLEPNMIKTVEPGIYFCREYIEGYYLSSAVHSAFIDSNVLETFYDVGGVRIEDDVLVTADGHENLTKAPKGQELLDIINGRCH